MVPSRLRTSSRSVMFPSDNLGFLTDAGSESRFNSEDINLNRVACSSFEFRFCLAKGTTASKASLLRHLSGVSTQSTVEDQAVDCCPRTG